MEKEGIYLKHTYCHSKYFNASYAIGQLNKLINDFCHLSFSYPRLDITWSRVHRSHHHYYRRSHRHRNRLENFRLLQDSPLMPADYQDYQYRAATDGGVGAIASAVAATPNFVSEETTHHRKRHVQHKQNHDNVNSRSTEDESHYQRQRRSLNRNSSRRRFARTPHAIKS